MDKEKKKVLFAEWDRQMARQFPEFCRRPGTFTERCAIAYLWQIRAKLELRIVVLALPKSDRFTVELGWGPGPFDPAAQYTWVGPSAELVPPDHNVRLPALWQKGSVEPAWYFGPRSEAGTVFPLWIFEEPEAAVNDAILQLREFGLPYFRRILVANEPGGLESFDRMARAER